MIFSDEFIKKLRETGVNSQNLKNMVLLVAAKCAQLEKELKNGSNAKSDPQSSDTVVSKG